jgi:hypothetical protein
VEDRNEVGHAAPRGRRTVAAANAERELADRFGEPVDLPAGALVITGPTTCPACGATTVEWAALAVQLERDQVHPILWHETERLADSFICATCDAGWYEPDDPRPFRWVRPYWIIG